MNKVLFTQARGVLRVTGGMVIMLSLMLGLMAAAPARKPLAPLGQTIWLRANANNLYVSADQNLANVQLIANRTTPQGWEMFTVVDAGGGLIALRASNGLYVSADTNIAAYAPLVANRPTFSTWEKFTWTDVGAGQVTLRASTNGRYVSADLNRSANLVADRTTAQGWETFTWGTGSTPLPTTAPTPIPGWRLVWSDEFNGSTVDTSNWNFQTGCSGWGNGEWENYTNGANASIQNGTLVIEARMKPGAALGNCGMTSTRMNSAGKRSFQYGRMEARLSIPMGQGLWPAFWMMGNSGSWPANGEIDIMEHISNENRTHGYIHWDNGGHQQTGGSIVNNSPGSFHVYAIEWDASSIRWFLDSTQFASANIQGGVNGTSEFHQPFYFLLNLAVGGGWPGYPNSTSIMPARFVIDYVRAYQR
jgi:beta-glucanase (GH16 family)